MKRIWIAVSTVAIAGFGRAQYSTDILAQLDRSQAIVANNMQRQFDLMNEVLRAIECGDWERAYSKKIDYINEVEYSDPDVNKAANYLELAMLAWNTDRCLSAERYLEKSIWYMRNGDALGDGCESRAVTFLAKLRRQELPSIFNSRDIGGAGGVADFIMELPRMKFNAKMDARIRRSEEFAAYFGSMANSYELQGRLDSSRSKAYARQEYQRSTGRLFDPSDPPALGTAARDKWDSAKRIYDIFDR